MGASADAASAAPFPITKFNRQPPWVGPSPTGDLGRCGAPGNLVFHAQCRMVNTIAVKPPLYVTSPSKPSRSAYRTNRVRMRQENLV